MSNARQMKYCYTIFVLLTLSTIITSVTCKYQVNVTIWCETLPSDGTKLKLNQLVTLLNKRYNNRYFSVNILSLNFSFNQAHHIFHSMQNCSRNDMQYVITGLSLKNTWLWSKLLTNKHTMFIDVHNPTHGSEEELFLTNMLSLVPAEDEKMNLLQKIVRHMQCRKVATLTGPSSRKNKQILRKEFKEIKEGMVYCIVVECSSFCEDIFRLAQSYDLLGTSYRWFSLYHFENLNEFQYLPRNLISVVLSNGWNNEKKMNDHDLNMGYVSDALVLIAEGSVNYDKTFENYSAKRNTGSMKDDPYQINKESAPLDLYEEPIFITDSYPVRFLETRFKGETGLVFFSSSNHSRLGVNYDVNQLVSIRNVIGWLKIGMWDNASFDTSLMTWILNEVSRINPPLLRIATKKSRPWMFFVSEQRINEDTSQCIVGMKCINYTTYYSETNNTFVQHCCTGMLVELLKELMKRVSFTPRIHFVKDKKFGSFDANTNQWNGMIGEVLRNEADTALYSLTITERRAKVVNFSYPIIAAGSGILISLNIHEDYDMNYTFFQPFTTELWVLTLTVLGAVTIVLWLAERFDQRRVYKTLLGNHNKLGLYSFMEMVNYGWGVFVQKVTQEGGPKTLSGRLVVGTFGFYMIIVLSSYTANLAAIKVADDDDIVITGIYDEKFMNPTSKFKFTSSKFTATSEFFKQSPDPRLNNIYNVMKDRLVSTRAEALKLLKSGEIQAFFEDTPSLHYMASQQENCDLKVVGKSFSNSGYGMPFRSNTTTWRKVISAALRDMHERGIIVKLSQKWLQGACVIKQNSNTARRLGIRDENGLLILLAVICFGSFLLLGSEFIFKKIFSTFCYTHARSSAYNITITPRL